MSRASLELQNRACTHLAARLQPPAPSICFLVAGSSSLNIYQGTEYQGKEAVMGCRLKGRYAGLRVCGTHTRKKVYWLEQQATSCCAMRLALCLLPERRSKSVTRERCKVTSSWKLLSHWHGTLTPGGGNQCQSIIRI
jgi:hypothetical protein